MRFETIVARWLVVLVLATPALAGTYQRDETRKRDPAYRGVPGVGSGSSTGSTTGRGGSTVTIAGTSTGTGSGSGTTSSETSSNSNSNNSNSGGVWKPSSNSSSDVGWEPTSNSNSGGPAGESTGTVSGPTSTGSGPNTNTPPTITGTAVNSNKPGSSTGGDYPPEITKPEREPEIPTGILPPPPGSRAAIARLVSKYGLLQIAGSQASLENLEWMEREFSKFPADSFKNLSVYFEAYGETYYTPATAAAYWRPDGDGGRITVLSEQVFRGLLAHELTHHITGYAALGWGEELAVKLGYQNDSMQYIRYWKPERVPDSAYPTDYARTNAAEHAADLIAVRVATEMEVLPSYRPTDAVRALLDRKVSRVGSR